MRAIYSDLAAEMREAGRLLQKGSGRVHFVGVCGMGMAGLAFLLKRRGFEVSGCDAHPNPLADWLRERGIPVAEGHAAAHTAGADWFIRTPAVPDNAEELVAARAAGKPVLRRGAVLPALLAGRTAISVSGSHGKTTTTSFITQVLKQAGLDPSFAVGGEVPALGGVAGAGADRVLVVEADESDGTAALYEPDIAVVTNVEFDHMEHFADEAEFVDCFRRLMRNARRVVFCQDDARASRLAAERGQCRSFGFSAGADFRAENFREDASGIAFALVSEGRALGEIRVPVRGRHNAFNALATVAVGLEMGIPFERIREGLESVQLPRRRLETVAERGGVTVISDYAHHPTEVAALIRTARGLGHRRILAVFQPHRYTRTLALGRDFPAAFAGVDELVLAPVYAASEKPLAGGSIWDLYRHFREQSDLRVSVGPSLDRIWAYFKICLREGDLLLVVGAGDVESIANRAHEEFARNGPAQGKAGNLAARLGLRNSVVRTDEPLASRTTLGVGGAVDIWVEIGSREDLVRLSRAAGEASVPLHVLGGGSNTLVSDLGVRGIVGRLAGEEFRAIRREGGAVTAGAAVPLARLCAYAEENGLSGFEFLEGIPGTVGGALCMNAGAWDEEIGKRVSWVRVLEPDGTERTIAAESLDFGYRTCPALKDRLILEAGFEWVEGRPETIRAKREEFAKRREWMKGMRSAGSVFRNPPGGFAGKLIEDAGLKGMKVGGAEISTLHANVITTEKGARASDVLALIGMASDEVRRRAGVELELEVVVLE